MAVLSVDLVTSVLLDDGWHGVKSGTIGLTMDPVFTDLITGAPLTPGGPWITFQDAGGVTYGAPLTAVRAVQWTPPPGA
jgi:hypothetical protein